MNNNIASSWQRILAYFIDLFIFFLIPICFFNLISTTADLSILLSRILFSIVFVVFAYPVLHAVFTSFMVSYFGGTLGKLLTGTKITSSEGSNLSFWKAFFRNHIGYMISGVFLWLGFVWILIDKERRSWHDQIADTYVITTNTLTSLIGLVVLIFVIFTEFYLTTSAVSNFNKNSGVYSEVVSIFKDSLPESTPIPSSLK